MANIESQLSNLYQSQFGRAADQGGMDYWKSQVGDTLDQNEIDAFIAAGRNNGETITPPPTFQNVDYSNTNNMNEMMQNSANGFIDSLNNMLNKTQQQFNPYLDAGRNAVGQASDIASRTYGNANLGKLNALNPNLTADVNSIQNDPAYQFELSQANELANRNLAGQGMSGSRYATDSLADVGRSVGSMGIDRDLARQGNNYNRAYNQYSGGFNMENQQALNQYNQQAGLASLGQNTAVNFGNLGANYNQSYGDLTTGLANATASNVLANDVLDSNRHSNNINTAIDAGGTVLNNWDTISSWF